jgi:hypothetical protein
LKLKISGGACRRASVSTPSATSEIRQRRVDVHGLLEEDLMIRTPNRLVI